MEEVLEELRSNGYVVHRSDHDGYISWRIMKIDGSAFARVCTLDDIPECVCLDSLSVVPTKRNSGIGTYLQDVRERMGKALGSFIECG